ncbi:MAG: FlgD immunoglobulin-like domain containing protein [Ignavibacteria bacterium]|nr:FlgD immunoglobulin-like domain containing protein [Ignavibacteria bacterium]
MKSSIVQISNSDKIKADTARINIGNMPGSMNEKYTPLQDSNYIRAYMMEVQQNVRYRIDLKRLNSDSGISVSGKRKANDPLDIPDDYYLPPATDVVNHEVNSLQSQETPKGIGYFYRNGLKFSLLFILGIIAKIFGLVEDVSPEITYNLDSPNEVSVVVFSANAVTVASLYEGIQRSGSYKYVWNGRDNAGNKLKRGNYFVEVRIGKDKYIRKRICI